MLSDEEVKALKVKAKEFVATGGDGETVSSAAQFLRPCGKASGGCIRPSSLNDLRRGDAVCEERIVAEHALRDINQPIGISEYRLPKAFPKNCSIGIILCKTKERIVAEYALRDINQPIGISEYRLAESLLEKLQGSLPTIEELENRTPRRNRERRRKKNSSELTGAAVLNR
jgi:hypothetical protein